MHMDAASYVNFFQAHQKFIKVWTSIIISLYGKKGIDSYLCYFLYININLRSQNP